jgi:hypothetical protein
MCGGLRCGSSHRTKTTSARFGVYGIGELSGQSSSCANITFDSRTHKPKVRLVKCSGYHRVRVSKK